MAPLRNIASLLELAERPSTKSERYYIRHYVDWRRVRHMRWLRPMTFKALTDKQVALVIVRLAILKNPSLFS